ncbi:MAG TPA: M20/M25/M40 family metallo-hydrolase [Thermoanaerobaculia bacterium]
MVSRICCAVSLVWLSLAGAAGADSAPAVDPRETHLADLVQLTRGGENAEAYWSPDGRQLVFQSTRPPFSCDQIFRMPADGAGEPAQVSNGKGRTTCAYFTADGGRVLYSSTHHAGEACPPPPDRSQGYVWPVDPDFEIWSARPDGSDPVRLTDNRAYDAEATVCSRDGSILFTSTRDGDLELYRMDADGKNVRRLTQTPGYDGGAFFSPDCSQIVWRASRPAEGAELDDYRGLLAKGLVRPSKLEIWMADADGGAARQVTSLGVASFAPSFFPLGPSGRRIIFSSNHGDPKGREFDLWAIDADGSNLERITWTPGFDGFPLFSPDGTRLAFASNRNQSAPGETNVFVARWVDGGEKSGAAERYRSDVQWLADDAREGRGVGTQGLDEARDWIAARLRELGLEPGEKGGAWFQSFEVPVAVEVGEGTAVAIDGKPLARSDFQPASFSSSGNEGRAEGELVVAGYGITAPELNVDDYHGIEARGKIVVVRRFTPDNLFFKEEGVSRRYGDLRYKAWNAREHGAKGLIVVDFPEGEEPPAEAPLSEPRIDTGLAVGSGDAGIPVVFLKRGAGAPLFQDDPQGGRRASLAVDLRFQMRQAANVVGVIRAGAPERLPGAVVVGAHYDHIGLGGQGSMAPDSREVHNGADDNASGTAALLEAARQLAARRSELQRDVYIVAFSGEEMGTLGSTHFTRQPPGGLRMDDFAGMLNMDMVGRLRGNALTVLGSESAENWDELVTPACKQAELACSLSGSGYGPSDHSPFYAAGVPVLHFFTGVHEDYHKPSDDADKVNAEGGARVAGVVAGVAERLANRPERLAYKNAPAPAPQGDVRSYGAALGTVPDYAGDGQPGVLLAGVRPGGAAEKGGMRRGDRLVELAGTEIRDIHDLMFVLRRSKPGETVKAVVDRKGEKVPLEVTFEASGRR